jgi:hypothetical protein
VCSVITIIEGVVINKSVTRLPENMDLEQKSFSIGAVQ